MSQEIFITAESADNAEPQRMTYEGCGHYFVKALPDFDEIAGKVGTRRISELAHYDPDIAADIAEYAEEFDLDPKWADRATYDQWYDASDGLVSIRAIRSYLNEHPEFVAERFKFFRSDLRRPRINATELMDELEQFEEALASLEKQKLRFRFEVC